MTISQDRSKNQVVIEDDRTGLDTATIKRAIAVAELMRLLVDEHSLDWDRAWKITQSTLGYT
ncbi:MAG TPA: glycogen/starch/alpha-glucan phosphorylase [Coleofasciculaceae cyanobacterium]|jgi:starch phosphorylase